MSSLLAYHDRGNFEVNTYSFSPEDNSIYKAKIINNSDYFNEIIFANFSDTAKKIYEDISNNIFRQSIIENNITVNYLVFIALRANGAYFMPSYMSVLYYYMLNDDYYQEHNPIFAKICESIILILSYIVNYIYEKLGGGDRALLAIMGSFFLWIYFINLFPIGYTVSFLGTDYTDTGWVYSIGLKGIQVIQGKYLGTLLGFTGLRLFIDSDFYMFGLALGSSLKEVD